MCPLFCKCSEVVENIQVGSVLDFAAIHLIDMIVLHADRYSCQKLVWFIVSVF